MFYILPYLKPTCNAFWFTDGLRKRLRELIRDTEMHTEESVCKRLYEREQQFSREITAHKLQTEELRQLLNDAVRENSSLQHCVITPSFP